MFSVLSLYQVSRLKDLLCRVPLPLRLRYSSLYFIVEFVTLCLVRSAGLVLNRFSCSSCKILVSQSLKFSYCQFDGLPKSLSRSFSSLLYVSSWFHQWLLFNLVFSIGSRFYLPQLSFRLMKCVFSLQSQSFLLIGFRFRFCIIIWFCIDLFPYSILTIEMLPLPAGPIALVVVQKVGILSTPLSLFLFVILIQTIAILNMLEPKRLLSLGLNPPLQILFLTQWLIQAQQRFLLFVVEPQQLFVLPVQQAF